MKSTPSLISVRMVIVGSNKLLMRRLMEVRSIDFGPPPNPLLLRSLNRS